MQTDLRELENIELDSGYNEDDGTWEVIVKYNGDLFFLEEVLGVEIELLSERYAIITLKQPQIADLYRYPQIEHIELPKRITFVVQEALSASCIPPVQNEALFGLSGKGVLVGVIDSGIDYTHPDFRKNDGSTRILYIWDQMGHGMPPENFKEGTEYDADQINAALASPQPYRIIPDMDAVGHGTAVAGVAAGNGRGSRNRVNQGVATQASIIVVRLGRKGQQSFARNTELMRALKYVVEKAQLLGMPVAINISYGTNDGSHDGESLFEAYIDDLSGKWKNVIVVAAGNEGISSHHYGGRLRAREVHDIDFYTAPGLTSFYLTLWKNFVDDFSVELILPNGKSTGIITAVGQPQVIDFIDLTVYVNYGLPTHYNVDQNIYFQIEAVNGNLPEGVWRLRLRSGNIVYGHYDIWLPVTEEVSRSTAFAIPTIETTLTLPATAFEVITVGAYNSRLNSIAAFSGRGYTRNNIAVKPDLVAPGVDIIAPNKNGGYDMFNGTSIAAPFVTGSAALMMEWGIVQGNDPFLYGERIKAFLRLGARRQIGVVYPNPYWGYGALCLAKTMEALNGYLRGEG